jgi:hypothetical protein
MELKTWKRNPSDNFTIVEVPSRKMVEIMLLNGGRECGTISGRNIFFWMVSIPDDRMEETLTIIRDLRIKGMIFDGVTDET